jgi:hypothetical protein
MRAQIFADAMLAQQGVAAAAPVGQLCREELRCSGYVQGRSKQIWRRRHHLSITDITEIMIVCFG